MTDSTVTSLRPAKTTLLKRFERVFDDSSLAPDTVEKKGPQRTKQQQGVSEPAPDQGIPATMQVYKQGGAVSEVNPSVIGSKFDTIA